MRYILSHKLLSGALLQDQTATVERSGSSLPPSSQSDSAARRFSAHADVADRVSGHGLSYVPLMSILGPR